MAVYLLHFDRPYKHARLYIGYVQSAQHLENRLQEHRSGQGARLLQVVIACGIGFTLARTRDGGRDLERQLKRRKCASRLCPICRRSESDDHSPHQSVSGEEKREARTQPGKRGQME